jgi:hypothetical protein
VTERGQVTDRYSKAIEQLGSDTLDVRLGGIYALEQIAKDSDRGADDQTTIVEVLGAFVRVHSDPLFQYQAARQPELTGTIGDQRKNALHYVKELGGPSVDVQAAVTVLGRLPTRPEMALSRGDLTGAWLRKTVLDNANLSGAKLDRATLTGANLSWSNLTGAWFTKAVLSDAVLTGAQLSQAWLERANLAGAGLGLATLRNVTLTGADLTGANLTGSRLSPSQLTETHGGSTTQLPEGMDPPESWGQSEAK